jgi:DNA/RNA endonuclease YhcR with UshA esterase domain
MKVLSCPSLLVILLVGCFSASLTAQTTLLIHDTEAIKHLGQYVTVEGSVVAVFISKNGNTFLSFGAPYPNQTFAGWILPNSELAGVSTVADLVGLAGKKLRISGTIELYKGKPEIRITSKKQIQQEKD